MVRVRSGATVLAAAALLILVSISFAVSMGRSARDSKQGEGVDEVDTLYERGIQLVEEGQYDDALGRFEQANRTRQDDPEILNMLAFCQRKTGDLEAAFENYGRALELRPKFPQAREYLGEAYLQAALQQLEILRGYGHEGREEAADLAAALRKAAADFGGAVPSEDETEVEEERSGRW